MTALTIFTYGSIEQGSIVEQGGSVLHEVEHLNRGAVCYMKLNTGAVCYMKLTRGTVCYMVLNRGAMWYMVLNRRAGRGFCATSYVRLRLAQFPPDVHQDHSISPQKLVMANWFDLLQGDGDCDWERLKLSLIAIIFELEMACLFLSEKSSKTPGDYATEKVNKDHIWYQWSFAFFNFVSHVKI